MRGLDFAEVEVVSRPGSDTSSTRAIVFENSGKTISMDLGEDLDNVTWLLRAIQAERAQPGLVFTE